MITDEQALANKIRVQNEGVQAWIGNGCKGTLEWATGVGKSKGALMCLEHVRSQYPIATPPRVLLVVPTEEMRDVDWPDEFSKWCVSNTCVKSICYASLSKEKLENYDFIIYDEGHRLTLPNLQKLYYFTGPTLCLTATFPKSKFEEDQERVAMITELLPPVHSISTDEAVELGLISDFEVFVLKFYLDALNKNIAGGTKKNPKMTTEKAEYQRLTKLMQFALMKKNEGMKFAAIGKRTQLLYNLPSKLRLAKLCLSNMSKEPKRTLVLCGSIEQANELCGENVCHSDVDNTALDRFQAQIIDIIAAVKKLNEGKNLINLEQELIIQVDSQERNLVQRIGRAVRKRPGRPDFKARIVILVALNTADEKWYKTAIKDFDSTRIKEFIVRVPDVSKSPLEATV